jgi:hypothetical protein
VAVFIASLERFCRQLLRGEDPVISPIQPSFGAWATALEVFAQLPQVSADLPYWQQLCGNGTLPLPPKRPKWKWAQARTLSLKAQIRLDARYSSASEQHDLLLAAFWHAWEAETGSKELFVELENHGRSTLADCQPWRTMGWFVNRFPARLHSPEPLAELDRLDFVQGYFRSKPAGGASFGLLAWLHRDAALRAQIERLPRPGVAFLFYRHLHDVHVDNRLFTVLREYSLTSSLEDAVDTIRLILQVNQRGGLTAWQILYDANLHPQGFVSALSDRIAEYLVKVTE